MTPETDAAHDDATLLATPEGSEAYWRDRHEGRPDWAELYWESQDLPERQAILAALERVAPFESVLELGCNAGPNLALIRHRWPRVRLLGIDINQAALDTCRRHFDHEPGLWPRPSLGQGSLYDLDVLGSDWVDVVLTSSVLIHIPPERIQQVLASAWRLARSAVVLCELHAERSLRYPDAVPPNGGQVRPGKWVYDYRALTAGMALDAGAAVGIDVLPPDVGWDTNARDGLRYRSVNAVITVRRSR